VSFDAKALEYLNWGWSVIPVRTDKRPVGDWKKWQSRAMTQEEATKAFSSRAVQGIAVVCGKVSGVTVLDLEQSSLESKEVEALLELAKGVPTARSGGGGVHLYFASSGERNKPLELNGVHIGDIRGEGGYVVLPPSCHPSDNIYEWVEKPTGNLEPIPQELQNALKQLTSKHHSRVKAKTSSNDAQRKYALSALEKECEAVRNAPQGVGNHQINVSAFALGQLVGAGVLSESEVLRDLENAVNTWATPDPKAKATILSGLEAGILEPRDMTKTGLSNLVDQVSNLDEQWGERGEYAVQNGRIVEVKVKKSTNSVNTLEKYVQPLCNFQARIEKELIRDDGIEQTSLLYLSGVLTTGEKLPYIDILASQFNSLNWVTDKWGSRAVVYSGQGQRDKLREAIQLRGLETRVTETVFSHTGWRKLEGKDWVYLHGNGAINQDGAVLGVQVKLTGSLEQYALPTPYAELEDVKQAIRTQLDFLTVAPDPLSIPLWLAVLRSVIDAARFTVFLVGRTGSRKSGLAGLALQHLAPSANWDALTTQWSSTDNALERVLFEAKDSMVVIDDFNPTGSRQDIQKYHARAERVLRTQGNGGGRSRLRHDATPRPETPPRGLVVSTGEDLPNGHSLRARCLILEIKQGDVDFDQLKALSKQAREGEFSQALIAFIRWLALDLEQYRQRFKNLALEAQGRFASTHGRTSMAAGELLATLHLWQDFALEQGHISLSEAQKLETRAFQALNFVSQLQEAHQASSDPVQQFPMQLRALIFSGRAHLISTERGQDLPLEPELWGWQHNDLHGWQPKGARIGWVKDRNTVYLEPNATFAALSEFLNHQGLGMAKSQKTLWGELAERGFIVKGDQNAVKRVVQGNKQRVLHLTNTCLQAMLEGDSSLVVPETPSGTSEKQGLNQAVHDSLNPVVPEIPENSDTRGQTYTKTQGGDSS
jgi:hypothetical protein